MDDTDERRAGSPPPPLTLTVRSSAELVQVRAAMRQWLNRALPSDKTDDVLLAGGEALANALEHGKAPITISLEWSSDGLLQLGVFDSGTWRVTAETARGLGIPIMTALMDSFAVETTDGTAVQLNRQFKT